MVASDNRPAPRGLGLFFLDCLCHQTTQLLRLKRICVHLALRKMGLESKYVLDVLGGHCHSNALAWCRAAL